MQTEIEVRLLSYIDRTQSELKGQGLSAARALKEVLKEIELTPQEYWDMCQTGIKYKE